MTIETSPHQNSVEPSLELDLLCTPLTHYPLQLSGSTLHGGDEVFELAQGVPVLRRSDTPSHLHFFESVYEASLEPWKYSRMAAEVVRHEYVVEKARKLIGSGRDALDIGCSLGQLTHRFWNLSQRVFAMDISVKAVLQAQSFCRKVWQERSQTLPQGGPDPFRFVVASATEMPFKTNSFDLIILSDGLVGWDLAPDLQVKALKEIQRIMKPGSFAILTDFMHPRDMKSYISRVRTCGVEVVEIDYFYDRLFYQLAVHFKILRKYSWVENFFESRRCYKWTQSISRWGGFRGSKHLILILKKTVQ